MNDMETDLPIEWIAFGPFLLFPGQRILKRDGKALQIGDKALDLLCTLIKRPGNFFDKAELTELVWRRGWIEDVNLRVTVSALRKVLGETPEGGDYIINAVGRGYSFSPAVAVEWWPKVFDKHDSAEPGKNGLGAAPLPLLLNRVIGREHVIAEIIRLLRDNRLVTIVGPGGIGKTTVAISSASQLAGVQGGVCFVDFAPVRAPDFVPTAIATALRAKGSTDDPTSHALRNLSESKLLLVLDNCEHVVGAVAEFVERILHCAPRVAIIVTSREPLRTEGEVVYRLDTLAYPSACEEIDSEQALTFSAIQLFVERTQAVVPEFVITDALAPAVSEICRRLDGIALAIQLAAGRVPALGVFGVASRLDDRFRLLSYGQRTSLPRHRTLEAAFDWSFGLLTGRERLVLERISIFCCSFTIDSAIRIAGWASINEADVASIVADLVDKSLVVFAGDEHGPSYRLLETVRAFAQARLQAGTDGNIVAERHAKYVLAGYREFGFDLAHNVDSAAGEIARAALDDLRSALKWSFDRSDQILAFDLVVAATPLMNHLGLAYELKAWITRVLEGETEPERRLVLLLGLGGALHLSQTEPNNLIQIRSETYRLAEELGDVTKMLQALWGLMVAAFMIPDPRQSLEAARKFYEIAIANARPIDALIGECMLACGFEALGKFAAAEHHLRKVLEYYPRGGLAEIKEHYLLNHRVVALRFLASIEWLTGRINDAAKTAALAVEEAENHIPSLFIALSRCACVVSIERADWTAAARYTDELYRRCGHHANWRLWADALNAILAIRVNQSETALTRLDAILSDPGAYQAPGTHAWYRLALIMGYLQFQQRERANSLLTTLIRESRERGDCWLLPEMLRIKAIIDLHDDPESAEALFREGIRLAREQGALLSELYIVVDYFIAKQLSSKKDARQLIKQSMAGLSKALDLPNQIAVRQLLWRKMRQSRLAPRPQVEASLSPVFPNY